MSRLVRSGERVLVLLVFAAVVKVGGLARMDLSLATDLEWGLKADAGERAQAQIGVYGPGGCRRGVVLSFDKRDLKALAAVTAVARTRVEAG